MYFQNCHTAADCKSRYRTLAKELHPDKNGRDDTAFKEMCNQYEQRLNELLNTTKNSGEKKQLAQLLLELLKLTQPEFYKQINIFFSKSFCKNGGKCFVSKSIGNTQPTNDY